MESTRVVDVECPSVGRERQAVRPLEVIRDHREAAVRRNSKHAIEWQFLLVGADDGLIPPAHSLSIADEIPAAERHVLEGVGHVGSVQAPEATAQIIERFLGTRR